jgi:hypothetical protein
MTKERAVLGWCLRYFANMDRANAAVHTGMVRYSPITFRLAEVLNATGMDHDADVQEVLDDVTDHSGMYTEDKGR